MRVSSRSGVILCVAITLCALGFVSWTSIRRAQRVGYVTRIDADDGRVDANSSTGYAGGRRWLVVPEHNNRSYAWIAQAQQMAARGEWRMRHVDDENAPFGHPLQSPSPYRWWLVAVGWWNHVLSGRPLPLALEDAALWADPILYALGLIGTVGFVGRRFGAPAAIVGAVALAAVFPLAATFLPGAPDDTGLSRLLALWSVLALLAGVSGRGGRGAFALAGVFGGLMLWVNTAAGLTALVGMGAGALAATTLSLAHRREPRPSANAIAGAVTPAHWRIWALAGALTSLGAYLIEYLPAHMDFELRVNHPLYGVAWLGLGEVLAWVEQLATDRAAARRPARIGCMLGGGLGLALLPLAFAWTRASWPWALDRYAGRLTFLPNGVVAPNFLTWVARDGINAAVIATVLPVAALIPIGWVLVRRRIPADDRKAVVVGCGAIVVGLIAATRQLTWWSLVDAEWVALAVTFAAALRGSTWRRGIRWSGLLVPIVAAGMIPLRPLPGTGDRVEFTRLEVEGLLERGLAHWVSAHAEPGTAVILLPPDQTTSWCFHGGMRGLGSSDWENRDGLDATVRIVTATTEAEAHALVREHRVNYLVLPSWDTDLDQFARWSLRNPEDAFVSALHHWALPPWLTPLPYRLPAIAGFEHHSVVVLAVTENASRAVALARLAEYFVETQQTDLARWLDESLQRYPADVSCLVARAEIAKLAGDPHEFSRALDAIQASVNGGFDRTLAWDRRVSLAIVLALADHQDLARSEARRCIESIDAGRIRSLTTASLYRLLALGKAYGLPIADPNQAALARALLPPELRSRL